MDQLYFSSFNILQSPFKRVRQYLIILGILFLSAPKSLAVITIHSVSTTISTCGNNGTATISATSNKANAYLLYEIVEGRIKVPMQNNTTFSSLFPDTYTVRVYDINNSESKDAQFTITGNYQLPDLLPHAVSPICQGFSDGRIEGHILPNKGLPPYRWQMIAPVTGTPQSSDVFSGLTEGNYIIQVKDACDNVQTRTVILTAGSTGLSPWGQVVPSMMKTGCDTMVFYQTFSLFKEKGNLPLKLTITTASGTFTKRVYPQALDTINYVPGLYAITDTIPGITYGSSLKACISDTCGASICTSRNQVAPFDFTLRYLSSNSCGDKMAAEIWLASDLDFKYDYTTVKAPIKMTLVDLATNTLADSMTCNYNGCRPLIKEQVSGRMYRLKIEDACGQIFQHDTLWPAPAAAFVQTSTGPGCMDSTATLYITPYNFKSYVDVELLSGPTVIKSTKPHYAFSSTITYPKTFPNAGGGLAIRDLPPGDYTYRVSDTCGAVVPGSFTITSSMVSDFHYTYSIKKGCLGNNTLYFDARSSNTEGAYVRNPATGETLYMRRGYQLSPVDSLTSLPPGQYVLQLFYGFDDLYGGGNFYNGTIADNNPNCWSMKDTITIFPPSNNSFQSHTTILCDGQIFTELNADTSRGVPPFQYEIIDGPQKFPLQNNSVFQLPTFGNYVIRIRDACGNTNIRQISIDTAGVPPVVKSGASCTGGRIKLKGISSSYLQYEWTTPNGTVYTGDSLIIDPLTVADTGIYRIKRTVQINGCTSISYSSYPVHLRDEWRQTVALCYNGAVHVGTNTYTVNGDYTDTLTNTLGCDSIVYTKLIIALPRVDTNRVVICEGQQHTVGLNNYNESGFYKDSTINAAGCYDVLYTDLTVLPLKRNTITLSICQGQQTTIGSRTYTQSGTYHDTLSTTGCDSIVVLHLTVIPYKTHLINRSVCEGTSVMIGTHTYNQSGTYRDTLSTTTCDSIVTLKLAVHPSPQVGLGKDTSLCAGQSLLLDAGSGYTNYFWNGSLIPSTQHTLSVNTANTYTVQVENSYGCLASDTLKVLSVFPLPVADAGPDDTLCTGEKAVLSASGGNSYHWSPGGNTQAQFSIQPILTTTYTLTAYDTHQCKASDNITVIVYPANTDAIFDSPNIGHCFDEGILTLKANWGTSFLWVPTAETSQTIQVAQDGTYTVTVSDAFSCPYQAQVIVTNQCETTLFIPTGFSPNSDGLHDNVQIFGKYFTAFHFLIFNRWGEIIFESTDREQQWDGLYRGEEMPIGTYPWIVTYRSIFDEQKELSQKGSITLIR